MPAGDGTGPMGVGPMTGRGAGYCAGYEAPGYANPWPRMGLGRGMGWRRGWSGAWGRGWGRGRGWQYGYHRAAQPFAARYAYGPPAALSPGYAPYAAPSTEDEVAYLRTQADWLRETLQTITDRIEELERGEVQPTVGP